MHVIRAKRCVEEHPDAWMLHADDHAVRPCGTEVKLQLEQAVISSSGAGRLQRTPDRTQHGGL